MEKLQVSILGDSISTYSRYNPKGYAVYYDIFAKKAYRMNSVRDTWWSQVLRGMKAKLCVNEKYSKNLLTYYVKGCNMHTCKVHAPNKTKGAMINENKC